MTVHALPEQDSADPALAPFLALLEADLAARPAEAVRPIPETLASRLEVVVSEVGEVNPDCQIASNCDPLFAPNFDPPEVLVWSVGAATLIRSKCAPRCPDAPARAYRNSVDLLRITLRTVERDTDSVRTISLIGRCSSK